MMWMEGRNEVLVELGRVYTSALVYLIQHAWTHSKEELHIIVVVGMCAALHVDVNHMADSLEEAMEMQRIIQRLHQTEKHSTPNPWRIVQRPEASG